MGTYSLDCSSHGANPSFFGALYLEKHSFEII